MEVFVQWFQRHGAYLDTSAMGITEFPAAEGGRGAVALKDIPEDHLLFTVPRTLTLSTRTSELPTRFGLDAWREAKLHQGWVGLILCMMWERANGASSRWAEYLDTLPDRFDTPMFWNESDLKELEGTSVVEKLGKADAELDYSNKLLPALKSRPDLFRPEDVPIYYTVDVYHIMGSRILSRSFVVDKWEGDDEEDDEINHAAANTSIGSAMNVDIPDDTQTSAHEHEEETGEEEEEEEDSSNIAMVPMADILNARYQTENAKLFYEKDELRMVSTKPIKAGEQIWNTYDDLPNAELLRRYGHVDILPLPSGGNGNPGDVVEVKADLILFVVSSLPGTLQEREARERIDWWLEEGGEDIFILEYDFEIPPSMISFAKLLLLSEPEWNKVQEKSKPPKPKFESIIYDIIVSTLQKRLSQYATTLEEDKLTLNDALPWNKKQALLVRTGEKEILQGTLSQLLEASKRTNKRKGGEDESTGKAKRSRR